MKKQFTAIPSKSATKIMATRAISDAVGQYLGVDYGFEKTTSNGEEQYYFIKKDGEVVRHPDEEGIKSKIENYVGASTRITAATKSFSKYQYEDALDVIDDALYKYDDLMPRGIADAIGLDEVRNAWYGGFNKIYNLILSDEGLSDEDKDQLIRSYHLDES